MDDQKKTRLRCYVVQIVDANGGVTLAARSSLSNALSVAFKADDDSSVKVYNVSSSRVEWDSDDPENAE